MKLGIIIPLIEDELDGFYSIINKVQLNLELALIDNYHIIVVFQSKNNIFLPLIKNVTFVITTFYSVSNARNIGLDKFQNNCDYIYLLDQDALPSVDFLIQSKTNMKLKTSIWSGKINWTGLTENKKNFSNNNIKKMNIFFFPRKTFLGCYFFKSDSINKTRFNLNLGPGENTKLKGGEDLLFLAVFCSRNNINNFKYYPNLYIDHPKRPSNNQKELLYLESQIAVSKHLVYNKQMLFEMRFGAFIYLLLFLANGFVKVLKMQKNSLIIFKRRLFYMFKKYNINV
jgi:hypothetical protein